MRRVKVEKGKRWREWGRGGVCGVEGVESDGRGRWRMVSFGGGRRGKGKNAGGCAEGGWGQYRDKGGGGVVRGGGSLDGIGIRFGGKRWRGGGDEGGENGERDISFVEE